MVRDPVRNVPRAIFGLNVPTSGASDEARALGFVRAHSALLGGIPADSLRLVSISRFGDRRTVFFQCTVNAGALGNVAVENRFVSIRLDADDHVRRVHSDFDHWRVEPVAEAVASEVARRNAMLHLEAGWAGPAERVLLPEQAGTARHVFRVRVARVPLLQHFRVYVDAATGLVLRAEPDNHDQPGVPR